MPPTPRLLVSVRNVEEARAALAGGCDILDIKEPANGPLGMANTATIGGIVASVTAAPTSAALGELTDWLRHDVVPSLPGNLDYVKLGLARMRNQSDWAMHWAEVRRRFDVASSARLKGVAVAYADWELAEAPPPLEVIEAAPAAGCGVLLVDTVTKDGRSLLDFLSAVELRAIASAARRRGLQLALAGSLRRDLLPRVAEFAPDIVAIRSAACRDGSRTGPVSAEAVSSFKQALARGAGCQPASTQVSL